jgi:hypothetical protein
MVQHWPIQKTRAYHTLLPHRHERAQKIDFTLTGPAAKVAVGVEIIKLGEASGINVSQHKHSNEGSRGW